MKLFYAPGTRAECVRWLLDELRVDYDIVFVNFQDGEHKSDLYKGFHPLGQLPALEDEGNIIIERAAIMMHLVDRFRAKNLAPFPGDPRRAAFYQLMVLAVATLEPAGAQLMADNNPETKAKFEDIISLIENSIEGPWLFGTQFTAADCLIGSQLIWANHLGLLEGRDKLQTYIKALTERPAYRQVPTDFPTTEQ